MMATSEDVKIAGDIIQSFLRAKKNLRLYPSNNPIYVKTVEDAYRRISEYFTYQDRLTFQLGRNDIFFEGESVYKGEGKDDNLALFFFRDGLREITFGKDLEEDEFREFLEVIAYDLERDEMEDDVVTLLWARDFQNIKYVVDEAALTEDEGYENDAARQATEAGSHGDDYLKSVYEAAEKSEKARETVAMPITKEELRSLIMEMERDSEDKKEKLIGMLFDMIVQSEDSAEFKDMVQVLTNALEFCVRMGDMQNSVRMFRMARELADSLDDSERKRIIGGVFFFAGSPALIKTVGEFLDREPGISPEEFSEFVSYLDKNAIPSFVSLLGDLETIGARKNVIEALSFLGRKDLKAVAKGLRDDRWYVVRNIIYVLRKIGDSTAVDYLLRAARHDDVRVRKEVLRTLGELGGQGSVQTIKDYFGDPDPSVRAVAARALSTVGSEPARKALLDRISDKAFLELEFSEKKEFFEALSRWKDRAVADFLRKAVRKSSLFKRASHNEVKACAAYCMGLIGDKEFLPDLEKLRKSKNRLLNEYAYNAIKRIEYGR
ncbi:MAG: HEAT repeat domain-containing protein [Thermodesulfovibrionales bacterium]